MLHTLPRGLILPVELMSAAVASGRMGLLAALVCALAGNGGRGIPLLVRHDTLFMTAVPYMLSCARSAVRERCLPNTRVSQGICRTVFNPGKTIASNTTLLSSTNNCCMM